MQYWTGKNSHASSSKVTRQAKRWSLLAGWSRVDQRAALRSFWYWSTRGDLDCRCCRRGASEFTGVEVISRENRTCAQWYKCYWSALKTNRPVSFHSRSHYLAIQCDGTSRAAVKNHGLWLDGLCFDVVVKVDGLVVPVPGSKECHADRNDLPTQTN